MGRGFESLLRHQSSRATIESSSIAGVHLRAPDSDFSVFRLLTILPFPVLRVLAAFVAFWVRVLGWRRGLLDGYLGRCLSDRTEAERKNVASGFYRYLGELVAEVFHGPRIAQAELEARVTLDNPEVVQSQLDAGKRVLILAAHHCNWEWLLLRCSTAFSEPLWAAYKPPTLASGDRALKRMRMRFGATLVPAKELVQSLLERRGTVRLLAMNADQSPAASNEQQTWLPFFGQETAFYRGPGWIASKMGYAVAFAAMRRVREGHYAVRFVPLTGAEQRIKDPDDVLVAYASALQAHVNEHPVEYFWAYKRWKRGKRLYDK